MKKIIVYEYDHKNMKRIEEQIKKNECEIVRLTPPSLWTKITDNQKSLEFYPHYFYDLTPIIISEGLRSEYWAQPIINFFNISMEQLDFDIYFIVENRYSNELKDVLYLYISEIESLEVNLNICENEILNIVDIDEDKLIQLQKFISDNLFGNERFQERLIQEIKNYRLFNKIGEQKIFSAFICGQSGIGKTETARLLHKFLSADENFIKINLGNYSDKNALSSLIGSPRGYIGSNKGELSDKIFKSKAKVILIDEFEKGGTEVHNFFLELLEDGKFTDSLGREFNLNKYIIIFTSNIKIKDVDKKLSSELQSRFSLMYRFSPVTEREKLNYLEYKVDLLLKKIKEELDIEFSQDSLTNIYAIETRRFSNLRKLNKEIMLRISQEYQKIVYGKL
ncbi:AAA family ATPase [Clostridium sporogenes]